MAENLSPRVTVQRDVHGWRADIPDLRTYRRARTLYALDRRVREVLGPGWVDYQFRTGDPALDRLVAGVRSGRRAALMAEDQVRVLTDQVLQLASDFSQRDLGVMLELSHQRVHQLLQRTNRPG